jgi:hypothetical protein
MDRRAFIAVLSGGLLAAPLAAEAQHAGKSMVRPRPALITGLVLIVVVLLFNVPGNPVLEFRQHRVAGMVLGHSGLVLLAFGLAPILSRALPAAAGIDARWLAVLLAIPVVGFGAAMVALAVAWPSYAHQLLTREWGLIEPLQFVLYLVAARLCFAMAHRSVAKPSSQRLYRLGGWVFRLFALEEIDYLGVPSSLARLAGVEGSRIGSSYVGALHDIANVAAEYGLVWILLLVIGLGALAVFWWASGGRAATVCHMLSWRLLPAGAGVGLLGLAQVKDVNGALLAPLTRSPLLDDLLEEPLELLAILALNVTLVLELARLERGAQLDTPNHSATPA